MSEIRNTESPEVNLAQQGDLTRMDNIEAMRRGRYSQDPVLPWHAKRIRNLFPK